MVYIGSGDQYLYKLNAKDGSLIWKFDGLIGGYPNNILSYARGDDLAYFDSGIVEPIARVAFDCSAHYHRADSYVTEDTIYIYNNRGWWYAIDPATNGTKWKFFQSRFRGGTATTQAPNVGTPTYYKGKLYFMDDFWQACNDAKIGGIIWRSQVGFMSETSCTSDNNGKIYTGSRAHSSCVFDAQTGHRISWYETNSRTHSSPSIAYGNVYEGSDDWRMYCFTEGTPRPPKDITTMTGTISAIEVKLGSIITINGKVTPERTKSNRWPIMVYAGLYRPDGQYIQVNEMGKEDGSYSISYTPTMAGEWKVEAFVWKDDYYNGTKSTAFRFTVKSADGVQASVPPTSLESIIPATADIYVYGAVVFIVIAIATLAAVWYKRGRKK
jgi:hypothetical protein